MYIGLKYQGMELMTMMFGQSIPIIGFLMREGTGKEKTIILTGSRRRNEKEDATHILRGRK